MIGCLNLQRFVTLLHWLNVKYYEKSNNKNQKVEIRNNI